MSGGRAPLILSWPAEGGEGGQWSASSPSRYFPRQSKPPVPTEREALWAQQPVQALWRAHILSPLPGKEPRLLGCPARSLVALPTELSRLPVATIYASLITTMGSNSTGHHGHTTVTCFVSISIQDLKAGSNVHIPTKPSYSDRKSRSFRPAHRPCLLQMQQTMATEKRCRLPFHIINPYPANVENRVSS